MASTTISFLGGAREVGKSGYLIQHEDESVLLDYGLQLTEPVSFPEKPARADALLLSHAHLDHSGGIPYIHRKNPLAIYGIDVSFDLAQILLYDSVKINRLKNLQPPYSDGDVDRVPESEIAVKYGRSRKIGSLFTATFHDAGHIPGSAGILLEVGGKKIFYSGDTKYEDTLLLRGAQYPQADVLISEATYGNQLHPDRREVIEAFISKVEETCDRGGVAIVPAFGVGRSQEILMVLDAVDCPIYLDGMAKAVARVFLSYPEYLRDPDLLQKAANSARWVNNNQMRRDAAKEPCVIVTTAGMMTGGPVLEYVQRVRKDTKSSILIVGYQVKGTNGRRLLDEGYVVDEKTGKKLSVQSEVCFFDFSAHSDQAGLIKMADQVSPEKIILVHGEEEGTKALAEKLSEKYDVRTPRNGEKIILKQA